MLLLATVAWKIRDMCYSVGCAWPTNGRCFGSVGRGMVCKWMVCCFLLEMGGCMGEKCMAFLCIPVSIRKFFVWKQTPRLWNMNSWVSSSSKCTVMSPNIATLLVTTVTAGRSMEAKTHRKSFMVAQCSWLHKGNSLLAVIYNVLDCRIMKMM